MATPLSSASTPFVIPGTAVVASVLTSSAGPLVPLTSTSVSVSSGLPVSSAVSVVSSSSAPVSMPAVSTVSSATSSSTVGK